MCGISVVALEGPGDLRETLLRMHDAIPHRGPDGEGFLLVGGDGRPRFFRTREDLESADATPARIGIGFRWLKIQDPAEGAAQPMASDDASTWLVFNGEVYNHAELREELRGKGHAFSTGSDTEVVLGAYREWGEDCFRRFNGMWAIVVVDLARGRLVVSRDRFGIKPLFHARRGGWLLLASECKQILAASPGTAAPNLGAVVGYLQGLRSHLGDETFFEGVTAVPPATWAELWPGTGVEPAFHAYWDLAGLACADPRRGPAFPEACSRLEKLLRSAVDLERRASVPVGSLLSGGLDSSLLASMQAELLGASASVRTVSLVMEGVGTDLYESRYVNDVVRHRSLESLRVSLDADWVRGNAAKVARVQGEPPAGMAVLGQYRVFEGAAESGMRVLLDGQGADELFAGYPRHQDELLLDRLLGGRLADLGRELRALNREQPGFLRGFLGRALVARARRRFPCPAYAWLRVDGVPRLRAPGGRSRDASRLNRALYADVTGTNLKAVLAITDRNSMAHSIEARVPYLDHRIVELAFQLPDHYKAGAGLRKRVLREVARGHLPASVVSRRDKIGFGMPEREWIRGELRAPIRSAAEEISGRFARALDGGRLRAFVEGFYSGAHDDFRALWRCYALREWAEAHGVTQA
jgi:asparagine synthase (glutamine-hydrolysing)